MTEFMTVDDGAGRTRAVKVDYPSNSKKSKQEKPEREVPDKVITGNVVTRKKHFGSGFFGGFVAEDGASVGQYVIMEVLLPAAKNMISDAVSQGVERMLFGNERPRSANGGRPGYVNYSARSATGVVSETRNRARTREARTSHDFSDIILETRAEAEDVLDQLRDLIGTYEVASVSDLYALVGLTGEFTDENWGWSDLRSASIRPIRGGYLLILPRTQSLV